VDVVCVDRVMSVLISHVLRLLMCLTTNFSRTLGFNRLPLRTDLHARNDLGKPKDLASRISLKSLFLFEMCRAHEGKYVISFAVQALRIVGR
jgi:hypothetical protein